MIADWEGKTSSYVHADHHWLGYNSSGVLFNGNDGGIYKTYNNGASWTDISDGLNILQVDRIGSSQNNSSVVITGNQDNGTMIYRTTDNSWNQVYEGDGADCFIDKKDNNNLYISHTNGGLLKSSDGGQEFVSIKPPETGEGAWHTPFVLNPENNDILFTGFNDVWKSNDKGTTWKKISMNLSPEKSLTQLIIAPSNANYIYATTGTKHWVTKNGGQSWVEITSTDLPDLYLTYFAIADNNPDLVWATFSGFSNGQKVYYSQNGGDSWTNISDGLPNVPINCIERERQSNDVLYLGTDIGVFYKDASLSSWELFSNNLPTVVISELEIQYSDGLLRAGTRGRGLWETLIPLSNTSAPYIVKAEIISEGKQIELTFNKSMADPVGKETEFIISNGSTITATSIRLKEGTTDVYIINLAVGIEKDDIVTISYIDGSIASVDGDKLSSFVNKGVENSLGSSYINIEKADEIKVYPNPNNGTFEIECSLDNVTELLVKLVNLNGQVVYNKKFKETSGLFKRSLSIPQNIKGTYFFLIENGKKKFQKTIVVE
ncbi:MAG: T9SS type A sorting domain-containing protein [Chloroflexia bacterium]|nr:T9SS type A sorting domain-containing protein [Chloroflexia bacterium]